MTRKRSTPGSGSALRRRAERTLRQQSTGPSRPRGRADAAVHELQVHRVELELQNEELRRVRTELETTLGRLEALFELAPVGYVTVSALGRVERVNQRATELLGRPPEALPRRPLRGLFPPGERAAVDALLETLRQGASRSTCQVTLPMRGRHPVTVKLDGVASDGPRPGAYRISLTDVTELVAAQAVLREEDRRLVAFLGVLSHELRNPLAAATSALSILERVEPGPAGAARALATVGRQLGHLGRLVDDLLDVARITNGKVRLQRAPVRLDELVRVAGEDHRALLASRGLELEVSLPDGAPWTVGDAARLAQVVGNLLQNAARFTPAGGRVALALVQVRDVAEIGVRDSGAGLAAADLERIFEPFAQAQDGASHGPGGPGLGLGLGLALARQFTELHGGTVEARSEGLGRGSLFTVRLPLAEPPAAGLSPAAGEREPPAGPRRVLVVDDNREAAEALGELIGLSGHPVDVAFDVASALAMARRHPPALVLSDLGLPGPSGFDLARALRSDARFDASWLVALSGYALPEDMLESVRAGFDQHVAKPMQTATLERLLQAAPPPRRGSPS